MYDGNDAGGLATFWHAIELCFDWRDEVCMQSYVMRQNTACPLLLLRHSSQHLCSMPQQY